MNAKDYINNLEPPLSDIVKKLQSVVKASSGDIKEEIKWNVPVYSINKNICAIMAHKNHVNFQVFQGAHIASAELLNGTGASMRHKQFETVNDIKVAEIKKIMKQAIALDKM